MGSNSDRGRSPVKWVDLPYMFVHLYVWLFIPPLGHPARLEAKPARPEAQPSRPETRPATCEALTASQASGFRPCWLGIRFGWLASGLARWLIGGNIRTNVHTYKRTNIHYEISPFYRTSSPIKADALLPSKRTKVMSLPLLQVHQF